MNAKRRKIHNELQPQDFLNLYLRNKRSEHKDKKILSTWWLTRSNSHGPKKEIQGGPGGYPPDKMWIHFSFCSSSRLSGRFKEKKKKYMGGIEKKEGGSEKIFCRQREHNTTHKTTVLCTVETNKYTWSQLCVTSSLLLSCHFQSINNSSKGFVWKKVVYFI